MARLNSIAIFGPKDVERQEEVDEHETYAQTRRSVCWTTTAKRRIEMSKERKIVDARADKDGNIEAVKFEGNQRFTPTKRAIPILEREGSENAHVVHPKGGDPYIRTNPDKSEGNNLDEMAKK